MGRAVGTDLLVLVDVFSRCKAAVIPCANALSSSVSRALFLPLLCWFLSETWMNERGGYTLTLYTHQWLISKKNGQILFLPFTLEAAALASNLLFHQFTL